MFYVLNSVSHFLVLYSLVQDKCYFVLSSYCIPKMTENVLTSASLQKNIIIAYQTIRRMTIFECDLDAPVSGGIFC